MSFSQNRDTTRRPSQNSRVRSLRCGGSGFGDREYAGSVRAIGRAPGRGKERLSVPLGM
jgi:hypothetical protein